MGNSKKSTEWNCLSGLIFYQNLTQNLTLPEHCNWLEADLLILLMWTLNLNWLSVSSPSSLTKAKISAFLFETLKCSGIFPRLIP